jgi:methylated-DNA-protein-cysteine methyltransferase related protein
MKRQELNHRVYDIVSIIPYGKVATYGQIALMLGIPQCARQVGHALHHAPDYLELPCHRVVNNAGRLVPGWPEQRIRLTKEGVCFKENGNVELKQSIWRTANEIGIEVQRERLP